jgi:hypothetical protein
MTSDRTILLIEDDLVDPITVKRCLKEIQATNPLQVFGIDEDALEYLRAETTYAPTFILLDINIVRTAHSNWNPSQSASD